MATAEVNTITVLEFSFQTLQQQVVKVIAAELIVAVAGKHFGDVALNADDRNVEGAAAKVVDHGGVGGKHRRNRRRGWRQLAPLACSLWESSPQ